jgi:hypothetical protein
MLENIKFQSYCWSLGTTSFRVKDLNFKIERQLQILKELWDENPEINWNGNDVIQEEYYNKMIEKGFITGEANNKAKDARQKTSGIVQIGVIDDNRRISKIGQKIVDIVEQDNFKGDNIFNINKDSYIYLKQLLKLQITDNGINVKPFAVLLYFLAELKYLSKDEFTYILPLATNQEYTELMLENIKMLRDSKKTIEEIIQRKMWNMLNYKSAIKFIKENGINNIEEFSVIDMGRKGTKYIEPMYKFFNDLYEISQREFDEQALDTIIAFVKEQTKKNSKVAKYWKKYLKYSPRMLTEEYLEEIREIPLFNFKDKKEYAIEFFKVMHTAKWKATLEDYADLNKRYISLSDIVIFDDDKIELDVFPKYFFLNISKEIVNTPILSKEEYNNFILEDIEFNKIYNCLDINVDDVIIQIQADYPDKVVSKDSIKSFIEDEKLRRFNELIDTKFSENQLIKLFNDIERNDRNAINEYADWNSDIPTIFEYILGITWYRFSNRSGNILEYMKLSLDANLLPKTHAAGGTADIVYEYNRNEEYPEHKVLLEATLTESTSQRKNEMEPVSRHLMREIQENDNDDTYAVFVANILQEEVLSDFRSRKNYQFRSKNSVKTGLKIISLSIQDIIKLINVKVQYSKLYGIFETAYKDTEINDLEWYEKLIKNKVNNL